MCISGIINRVFPCYKERETDRDFLEGQEFDAGGVAQREDGGHPEKVQTLATLYEEGGNAVIHLANKTINFFGKQSVQHSTPCMTSSMTSIIDRGTNAAEHSSQQSARPYYMKSAEYSASSSWN